MRYKLLLAVLLASLPALVCAACKGRWGKP